MGADEGPGRARSYTRGGSAATLLMANFEGKTKRPCSSTLRPPPPPEAETGWRLTREEKCDMSPEQAEDGSAPFSV